MFQDNLISGFVDFDLSLRSIRLWDPCYCATGLLSEGRELAKTNRDMLGYVITQKDKISSIFQPKG